MATDLTFATISGVSGPIVINAAATHFGVTGFPSHITAGAPFSFTVTALDQFNNTATGFTGSVVFSSSDTGAHTSLPPVGLLTSGTGTFSATLTTAGSQTLLVGPTNLNLSTGLDASNNLIGTNGSNDAHWTVDQASGGTGPAQIVTSSGADWAGLWLADGPNSDWIARNANIVNNGAAPYTLYRTFNLTGYNLSSVSISGGWTIDDGGTLSLNGNQLASLGSSNWGTLNSFSVPAGSPFLNQGVNTLTITITDSDEFLEAVRLEGGVTVGQVVTTITAATGMITVSPAAASHFAVTAPKAAFAGSTLPFTVTAQDPFNNTATAYTGTAGFSSTDTAANLPPISILANGVGVFSVTLNTLGTQILTATDKAASGISGASNAIVVTGPATHFAISLPAAFTTLALKSDATTLAAGLGSGVPSQAIQARLDTPNTSGLNFAPALVGGYGVSIAVPSSYPTGTSLLNIPPGDGENGYYETTFTLPSGFSGIQLSGAGIADDIARVYLNGNPLTPAILSSDPQRIRSNGENFQTQNASFFNAGQNVLLIALANTGGGPSAVAFYANISYYQTGVTGPIPAGTPLIFTVTAQDQFNNTALAYSGNVHFTSSDSLAGLPSNTTLVSGTTVFSATLRTAGSQVLIATDTTQSNISGISGPIVVSGTAATHFAVSGMSGNATAGMPFQFTVTAEDPFNNTATGYSGNVHFRSNDPNAVLPIFTPLTSGVGVFSATLQTVGSQSLSAEGSPPGGPNFVAAPGSPLNFFYVAPNLVAGDFNGDGKLDLAAAFHSFSQQRQRHVRVDRSDRSRLLPRRTDCGGFQWGRQARPGLSNRQHCWRSFGQRQRHLWADHVLSGRQ